MSEFNLYAGVDWATTAHQVCVVDGKGKRLLERSFEHSAEGLGALADAMMKLGDETPETIAVAIETPRGAVVETLLERGFAVHSINPKQLDRLRDRHTLPGAKDDRRDAFVLADSLRNDRHLFRHLSIDEPLVIQLRETVREDKELGHDFNRVCNQLRDLLLRYFPSLLKLCPAANEEWLWTLLELASTPDKARRLRRAKLAAHLRIHRIRRFTGEELHEVLQEPTLKLADGSVQAASAHVRRLLPRLKLIASAQSQVRSTMDGILAELSEKTPGQKGEHRDVTILLSLPGAGRIVTASMLAEASDGVRNADYLALRAYGGTAPVTKRSGKSTQVLMRRSCSPILRDAFYHWARIAAQNDSKAKHRYAEGRSRGQTHGRALRGVADWLLRVATAMLRNRTLYRPPETSTVAA